jgi:hypothetical protein
VFSLGKPAYGADDCWNEVRPSENMSKEGKPNASSKGHPHDDWDIERDDVKLQEVISSLRTLVSGQTNTVLHTYRASKSNFILVYYFASFCETIANLF